jgi:hypothetical protein
MKNVRTERRKTKNALMKLKQKYTEGRLNYFEGR